MKWLVMLVALTSFAVADPKPKPAPAPLAVMKIEPNLGDAEGGTYVRVVGAGFLADATVRAVKIYFGSRQGEVIRTVSDTELIVQAPGGKVDQTVDVLVIVEGRGEIKLPKAFKFVTKP
jgi:hypothetical protein